MQIFSKVIKYEGKYIKKGRYMGGGWALGHCSRYMDHEYPVKHEGKGWGFQAGVLKGDFACHRYFS